MRQDESLLTLAVAVAVERAAFVRAAGHWQDVAGKSSGHAVPHYIFQHLCLLDREQVARRQRKTGIEWRMGEKKRKRKKEEKEKEKKKTRGGGATVNFYASTPPPPV